MDRETLLDALRRWADCIDNHGGEVIEFSMDNPLPLSKFKAANAHFEGELTPLEAFYCNLASRVRFVWDWGDYCGSFCWSFHQVDWILPEEYYWTNELPSTERDLRLLTVEEFANGDQLVLFCKGENRGKIGFFYHDDALSNLNPFVFGDVEYLLTTWSRIAFASLECYDDFTDTVTGRFSADTEVGEMLRRSLQFEG